MTVIMMTQKMRSPLATEIRTVSIAVLNNYTSLKEWGVITHPSLYSSDGLVKLTLNSRHE